MSYELHPCSIPNDPAADERAAAEAAAGAAADMAERKRILAVINARVAEEARVAEALAAELALAAEAAAAADPGAVVQDEARQDAAVSAGPAGEGPRDGFGRGWIAAERDIGLPEDAFGEGGDGAFLPHGGRGPTEGGGGARADCPEGAVEHGPNVPLHHASHGPPPPVGEEPVSRVWRSIDFTPPRRAMFIHHLAEQGNVRVACSLVRISAQSVYLARRRDAIFRAAWDAALVESREHALQVLANRALEGIREEVWHRGELVGHRVRHDTRLLLAHLGRLDARCTDAAALRRAERLDELLALVAGEDFSCNLRDAADGAGPDGCDEILPATRDHFSNRAAAAAERGWSVEEDEGVTIDQDELIARELAEAEWDEWGARVDAVNDALEAGEEPVIQPAPAPAGAEPPYEVKSLDGIPRAGRGEGPEFFARTPFGSSTWSAAKGAGARKSAGARRDGALFAQPPSATEAGRQGLPC